MQTRVGVAMACGAQAIEQGTFLTTYVGEMLTIPGESTSVSSLIIKTNQLSSY